MALVSLSNRDASFFTIDSPDIQGQVISQDIINITLTEELGKFDTGTMTVYDPNFFYTTKMTFGTRLLIAFGYRKVDLSNKSLLGFLRNPLEFKGLLQRRNVSAVVTSVAGKGDNNGIHIYTVNFMIRGEFGDDRALRWYRVGTRATVVAEVFAEMGVPTPIIAFTKGFQPITPDTAILRDNETPFRFLRRMAKEWRCEVKVGTSAAGLGVGLFVDGSKVSSTPFNQIASHAIGTSHLFEWKGGVANVIEYSWKNNLGASGVGDNVSLVQVGGRIQFIRQRAFGETVKTYRLNFGEIQAEIKRRREKGGFIAASALVSEVVNATTFQQVEHFWEPYEYKTAPQGAGYEIEGKSFGNPHMSAGNSVKFDAGFPPRLRQVRRNYYLRKVDHVFSGDGYQNQWNVHDVNPDTFGGI